VEEKIKKNHKTNSFWQKKALCTLLFIFSDQAFSAIIDQYFLYIDQLSPNDTALIVLPGHIRNHNCHII